jgi:toxin ParE1/3/4
MKLTFSALAKRDVIETVVYIKSELNNPPAAAKFRNSLAKRSGMLEKFPELGASLNAVDGRLNGYRYLVISNYILIYKVTKSEIIVLRVLYGRSNYVELLSD